MIGLHSVPSWGMTWCLLILALAFPMTVTAQSEQPKRVVWKGVETFENAYSYSGRISAHLGNVNEYHHKITIRFTYVEETDAQGKQNITSHKISWQAEGKAVATGFTSTTCKGSGALELVGLSYEEQYKKLGIPCTTKNNGILAGSFTKPPDGIKVPKIVSREKLRNNCSYSEEKTAPSGERYTYSVWVSPGCKCDPSLYDDYLRKRQVARELFKHASDLRSTARKLVAERLGAEADNLRFEVEKDVVGDWAWEDFGRHVQKGMRGSRSALSETWLARQAVANAPFAIKSWNAIGWVAEAVLATDRGLKTAGEWTDYQKEAQEATKQAEEMWRKALADFVAYLKQAPQCLKESRAAAEDEKRLDRAKAAIEEWDNNQALYWDPIKNEAVDADAALIRAVEYLKSGKISLWFSNPGFLAAAFAPTDDEPSQQALAAAIRELDKAISSFERLNGLITKYLSAQKSIEQKLETAFGITGTPSLIPRSVAPKTTRAVKKIGA